MVHCIYTGPFELQLRKGLNLSNKFKFIDLFAGIGGFRKSFESIGGSCVFSSESDKFCVETYLANYNCDNHDVHWDDFRSKDIRAIPPHDVVLAGFPCQPFSLAGVSKKNALGHKHGFQCQSQGTLFFEVVRILEHHRPKAFLLENVKNLLSHDKGRTFDVIRQTLVDELGYIINSRVIDARGFVPQHRERVYIAGFRNTDKFTFDDVVLPDNKSGPRLSSILHTEDGSENAEPPFTYGHLARVDSKYTISDHLWGYLQSYAKKHRAKGNGFGFGLVGGNDISRTLSARYFKDGSEILIKQTNKRNPRRLTPRECSRLMGFDALQESAFNIPVSDTQAYRQFGNAVVVPVVTAIAKTMSPLLN